MAGGPHSTSAAGENGAVSEEFIVSEDFIARTCLPATRREGRAVLGPVEGDLGLVEDAGRRRHEDRRPLVGTPRAHSRAHRQQPQIPASFCSGGDARTCGQEGDAPDVAAGAPEARGGFQQRSVTKRRARGIALPRALPQPRVARGAPRAPF